MFLFRAVFNMIVGNVSSRAPLCFKCLMCCLSELCELLFLLCLFPLRHELW